jgi:autotransporter-associated beta strand protein
MASGAVLELNVASGTADYPANTTLNGGGTVRKTGSGSAKWGVAVVNVALSSGGLIDVQQGYLGIGQYANDVMSSCQADLNVASGATFDSGGCNAYVNGVNGAGSITLAYTDGYARTLTMGVANGTGDFSGVISDGSSGGHGIVVKTGTGTQVLSGPNTYSGTTTVSNGTLVVNGSLAAGSAVTVQSNATLRGVGSIYGPVAVKPNATLAPGTNSTVGVLSIYNALTNAAGSITMMRLQPGVTPANDQVAGLTGVSYGGTLVVTNITGNSNLIALNDKFTLFVAPSGTYGGAFTSFVLPPLPAGLSWDTSGLTVDGSIAVANVAGTPIFNPPAGNNYLTALSVTISSLTSDATLHYTTDGTDPASSGTVLTGANPVTVVIPMNTNMTLRAYATRSGMVTSPENSASYVTWPVRTWTNTAGGLWSDATSWAQTLVGDGSGVTADFSTLTLPADTHVSLDGPRTLGTLVFGDRGTNSNWFLDIYSGDPLTLDAGTNTPVVTVSNQMATLGVALAGTQGLTKTGNGTLTLTGANTYTGTTSNSAGALRVTDLSNYRSSTVIASGATFEANVPTDVVAPNTFNITGIGTLVKTGAGLWQLGGQNARVGISMSPGGLIDVQEGTIGTGWHQQSWSNNLASMHIAAGATVDLPAENLWVDALTGSGTISNTYALNGMKTVYVGVANGSGTFDGVISSGSLLGLNKSGTGTQILSGTNTYTGGTIVSGGTLLINGVLDNTAVTVQTNATLGGLGTIAGTVTLQTNATLAPGGSAIGTLSTGGETWNAGSVVVCKIAGITDDSASRDHLTINGTLDLSQLGSTATASLRLVSMLNSNTPGNMPGFDPAGSYTWTIGSATGLNPLDPSALSLITLNTSAFSNPHPGTFSLSVDIGTGSLLLQYTGSATVSTNADLAALAITPLGTLTPAFASNVLSYTTTEAYANGPITVTPTAADPAATIQLIYGGTTNTVPSGSASSPLPLDANPLVVNALTVRVKAADTATTKDYTVSVARLPSTTPPTLSRSYGGGSLTLSWPLDHNGYTLLSQTNSRSVGLTGTWYPVAGSTATNTMSFQVSPVAPTVFYRLMHP